MRRFLLILSLALLCGAAAPAQPKLPSQWNGARVAFLGDSITDARQIGTTNDVYWHMLEDILGIKPYVYGISGHRMNQIIGQGERLEREHGQDVDAIIVFIGTNDFNGSIPMGEWYTYSYEKTIFANSRQPRGEVVRKHRELIYDDETFKGRANTTMRWLKTHYPDKQIIFRLRSTGLMPLSARPISSRPSLLPTPAASLSTTTCRPCRSWRTCGLCR